MPQAIDQAGNVWETDNAGNPLHLITPAQAGRVFSLSPNPKEVRQEARQSAADAVSAADRAADNARADEQLELARAANIRAERAANGDPVATAKQQAEWRANLENIKLLKGTVKSLRDQYNKHFAGKGLLKSLEESYAPVGLAPEYGVFDTTARSMIADMAKAKGLTATQFNTPAEAQMFFEPLVPKRGDPDEVIVSKLDAMERMIQGGEKTTLQNLGQDIESAKPDQKADNEVPDPTTGADMKPPPMVDTETGLPTDGRKITRDDRMSAQIDAMINAGASKGMIDAVLKRQNFPVVTAGEWKKIQEWRTGPGKGKKYFGADISRSEDLNAFQKVLANPYVNPIAAGAGHFANAATAGLVGNLAGEEGQGALDAAAALNPTAAAIGNIGGGVAGAMGAEAALAARAPAALAKFAPRIADALYGGALGFNTAREGEGLQGAALGAGAGLAGGYLGQKAFSGTGKALRGVQDANAGYLQGQGVPLTVGQAVGGSGRLGATVKNVEDALTSIPGVSSIVNARRMEGLEAFNQAAMRQAGAPAGIEVTAPGSAGMEQLRQGIGPAYDNALGGAQINTNDPAFAAALEQVVNSATAIPPVGGARDAAATALASRLVGATDPETGIMPGRGFQEAYRGLGRTARERAAGDYGHEVGQVMRQGQNVLAEALDAQNPGALQAFRDANSANRNANIIAQALDKAKNQGDELFTPAQINMADAMAAKRLEGPMASAAGDRPFFDLARAGQEVLPSRLPDSGTATRGLVGAGLIGGIGGAGVGSAFGDPGSGAQTGLGLTLLLAAGGSKPAQQMLVKALTSRPDAVRTFGDEIVKRAGIGGWTGAGTLAPLFVGQ
jgi:hypothetical protein